MSDTNPFPERLELRDASGSLLKVFVPAETPPNGAATARPLVEERDRLAGKVQRLARANRRLRKHLAALRAERDGYLRTLYAMLPRERTPLSDEELRQMQSSGLGLRELQAVIDQFRGG